MVICGSNSVTAFSNAEIKVVVIPFTFDYFYNLLPEEGARTLLAQDIKADEADSFGIQEQSLLER